MREKISLFFLLSVALLSALCVQCASPGYKVSSSSQTAYGWTGTLELIGAGPYGNDIKSLQFQVYYQTENILRVKIIDPNNARWEVPNINLLPVPTTKPSSVDYNVSFTESPFTFSVSRLGANPSVIFNTAVSNLNSLVFSDQYLEISTQLPSNYFLYGLGERIHSFRLQPDNTFTIWPRDQGTPLDKNLYGHHPFYLELRNGVAHGVFLLNSNAMDVVLNQNSLTYKTTGGILDFFVFLGPSPGQVITQYHTVIGFPVMPPYWALGWHQCRWGYSNLQMTKDAVDNYAKNGVPLDTIWNDIDYMAEYKDFTNDPNNFPPAQIRDFVKGLHANGQQYIMIVDPGISINPNYQSYNDLLKSGAYIKNPNGTALEGKVWPGATIFPDFLNPAAIDYWFQQIKNFHDSGPEFDGIWIDMNELSNFCDGQCYGIPAPNMPYVPGGERIDKSTIDINARTYLGPQYNTHSMYGWSEGIATKIALEKLRDKRAIVISRSTFAGSGSHNGHWLGDNNSNFKDLYYSIPGVLNMQLFGVNMVGADICGFGGDTTEELCTRWMQLGTLYPFSRNHNSIGSRSQEPYAFGPTLLNASIDSIKRRYSLLPYFYSQFTRAHQYGSLVWRPLFFAFPSDASTYSIDTQFMIGSALLVTPVLNQGATSVQGYFPNTLWYSWYDGSTQKPGTVTLDAPISFIPIHIRGGSIIPTQIPGMTVAQTRKNPYTLVVALGPQGDAVGDLYLDDGDEIDAYENNHYNNIAFALTNNTTSSSYTLTSTVSGGGWSGTASLSVANVTFLGVPKQPSKVTVNGGQTTNFVYTAAKQVLTVSSLTLPLNKQFTVSWNN